MFRWRFDQRKHFLLRGFRGIIQAIGRFFRPVRRAVASAGGVIIKVLSASLYGSAKKGWEIIKIIKEFLKTQKNSWLALYRFIRSSWKDSYSIISFFWCLLKGILGVFSAVIGQLYLFFFKVCPVFVIYVYLTKAVLLSYLFSLLNMFPLITYCIWWLLVFGCCVWIFFILRGLFTSFVIGGWLFFLGLIKKCLQYWGFFRDGSYQQRYFDFLRGDSTSAQKFWSFRYYFWRWRRRRYFWHILRVVGVFFVTILLCNIFYFNSWNLFVGFSNIYSQFLLKPLDIFIWSYLPAAAGCSAFWVFYQNSSWTSKYVLVYVNMFLNIFNIFWTWRPVVGRRWLILYFRVLRRGRRFFKKFRWVGQRCNIFFKHQFLGRLYFTLPEAIAATVAFKVVSMWNRLYNYNPWPIIWRRFGTSLKLYLIYHEFFAWFYWWRYFRYLCSRIFGRRIGYWLYRHFTRYQRLSSRCSRLVLFRYMVRKFWNLFYWNLVSYCVLLRGGLAVLIRDCGYWLGEAQINIRVRRWVREQLGVIKDKFGPYIPKKVFWDSKEERVRKKLKGRAIIEAAETKRKRRQVEKWARRERERTEFIQHLNNKDD